MNVGKDCLTMNYLLKELNINEVKYYGKRRSFGIVGCYLW